MNNQNTLKAKSVRSDIQQKINKFSQYDNQDIDLMVGKYLEIKIENQEDPVLKIKNRKAAGFDKIPLVIWKTRKFDNVLFQLCNVMYK